jgi:hypothetical protein
LLYTVLAVIRNQGDKARDFAALRFADCFFGFEPRRERGRGVGGRWRWAASYVPSISVACLVRQEANVFPGEAELLRMLPPIPGVICDRARH